MKLAQIAGVKAIYRSRVVAGPEARAWPAQRSGPRFRDHDDRRRRRAEHARARAATASRSASSTPASTSITRPSAAAGTPGTTSFPTARVIAGYDFVGDDYNASRHRAAAAGPGTRMPIPTTAPATAPTSRASSAPTAAASRAWRPGVALARIACSAATARPTSDIILAAIERAYADGMQVINQSLGSGRQWPQYPTAQASSRLVNKGIVMVASIGNNGPGGSSPDALFAAGAPGVGNKVIGVASYDNMRSCSFVVNGTPYGYNPATGSPFPPTTGSLPMAKHRHDPRPSTTPARRCPRAASPARPC